MRHEYPIGVGQLAGWQTAVPTMLGNTLTKHETE